MYTYLISDYTGIEDDLRSIFGIDAEILSNVVIHKLPNLPAAEMEVSERVTTALTSLTGNVLIKAQLAILQIAAANCLPAVKLAVLQEETDGKTSGKRFNDSLSDLTADDFLAKANKLISELNLLVTGASEARELLTFSSPSNDQITGDLNAG